MKGDYREFGVTEYEIPSINDNLLMQMMPYEATILGMEDYRSEIPSDLEFQRIMYLRHLKFWKYIYEVYKIDFVFFDEAP